MDSGHGVESHACLRYETALQNTVTLQLNGETDLILGEIIFWRRESQSNLSSRDMIQVSFI